MFSKKLDKRLRHNDVICIFCDRYMGILPSGHFDDRMTSYKILLLILDLESRNTPCTKFEQDQANILENMQVSSFFYSMTHS